MLIKTLVSYSLTYVVGITSSVAVHHAVTSPGTAAGFRSDNATKAAVFTQQIVNRAGKSNRLPIIGQVGSQSGDKAPAQVPGKMAPSPKLKANCAPPIDVYGRCFAIVRVNRKVT